MSYITKNLAEIRENITKAAAKSGRTARDITLVAVTKTISLPFLEEAVTLGINNFGENRVQELEDKFEHLPPPMVHWHMIGHLQTNKVKNVIDKVQMVHSLDRINLAEALQKKAIEIERVVPVLVQVNVAGEDTKYGLAVEEVEDFCAAMTAYPNLQVCGLMTIAPFLDDAEEVRPVFRQLRMLAEKVSGLNIPGVTMDYLSMGMSNDYTVAIEEGSNLVRIGSAIFGERN